MRFPNRYGYTRSAYTGTRIPEILERTGRKQTWLAKEMGRRPGPVNRVLRGRMPITVEFVADAVRVLGLPESVLFFAHDLLDSEQDNSRVMETADVAIA